MFKVNATGIILVSLLLTYLTLCSIVYIVNFKQVNSGWAAIGDKITLFRKEAIEKFDLYLELCYETIFME